MSFFFCLSYTFSHALIHLVHKVWSVRVPDISVRKVEGVSVEEPTRLGECLLIKDKVVASGPLETEIAGKYYIRLADLTARL